MKPFSQFLLCHRFKEKFYHCTSTFVEGEREKGDTKRYSFVEFLFTNSMYYSKTNSNITYTYVCIYGSEVKEDGQVKLSSTDRKSKER